MDFKQYTDVNPTIPFHVLWPEWEALKSLAKETLIQEDEMNVAASEAIMQDASEAVVEDIFIEVTSKIESMDQAALEAHIPSLIESVDFTYFELGLALSKYSEEGWWKKDDYASFRDSIEDQFGLHYRKAMYLMNISNSLVEAEIPWVKVAGLGWTKLKEIADILTNENVDEWVEKIMGPPIMTLLQLQDVVKAIKVGSLDADEPEIDLATSVTSISFKVHPDQKENIKAAVAKARGEAETEYDAVALDAICMNYMSGGNVKPKTLVSLFKAYKPEEVLEAFAVQWPEIDVTAKF